MCVEERHYGIQGNIRFESINITFNQGPCWETLKKEKKLKWKKFKTCD